MNHSAKTMAESWPRFDSAEGEAAYKAAYTATLELWPVAPESLDVPGRFGITHVNACGPRGAPPLVLLPGGVMNSTYWYLNVAALSRDHRVYALDTLGDYGLSVLQRKPKDRRDSAAWLTDVLDGLQIEQAHVAGHSYGGWQACNLALLAPERIDRLVLLAPAETLRPIVWGFFFLHVLPMLMFPDRARVGRFIQYVSATPRAEVVFKELVEQIYMGVRHIGLPRTVRPCVFSDDELRQLAAPTLVLIGDGELIYDPCAALARATRLIPHLEAALIPGAGHDLMRDQPARVNDATVQFFQKQAPAASQTIDQARVATGAAP